MMTFLSGLLERVLGAWLGRFTLPSLIMSALMGWHAYTQERDARIEVAAKNICDANWEASIRQQERDAAVIQMHAQTDMLNGERKITDGLRGQLTRIQTDLASARARASTDARCLSDGVLRSINGGGG